MKNSFLLCIVVFLISIQSYSQFAWNQLSQAPNNGGKQDGIFFITKDIGWVVNGSGKIFKTIDGGANWLQQKNAPGTYFRSVAFINEQIGFAGNVGTNYFPGVTDTNPLYKTIDGGNSWAPVTANITGIIPNGICAIQAVNANIVYAAGRVGGNQVIIKSTDGGNNWVGTSVATKCKMILDIYFETPEIGFIFAGTNTNVAASKARILRTVDGGITWNIVYTSTRNYEIIWKASFPTATTGFASIQSYDTVSSQRYIVKTSDGGLTWTELPLDNSGVREFGIGFINENVGWVGAETDGYETQDGGLTWNLAEIGSYTNKFSIVNNSDGTKTCYGVGLNVFKLDVNNLAANQFKSIKNDLLVYPNPAISGNYVSISLDKIKTKIIKSELFDINGKSIKILFDSYFMGTSESPFYYKLPDIASGSYILRFTDKNNKKFEQKILITTE
jgi:photosystem II stability/assembly factor-like uncharacterized protein